MGEGTGEYKLMNSPSKRLFFEILQFHTSIDNPLQHDFYLILFCSYHACFFSSFEFYLGQLMK